MKKMTIYLAGGITGLSLEEATEWRKLSKDLFKSFGNGHFSCFLPTDHFLDFSKNNDERAAMNYDLYKLRHSDILLINMNNPESLGTMAEISLAYELRIPMVAYIDKEDALDKVHPWQECMIDEWFSSLGDAVDYIINNYNPEY